MLTTDCLITKLKKQKSHKLWLYCGVNVSLLQKKVQDHEIISNIPPHCLTEVSLK